MKTHGMLFRSVMFIALLTLLASCASVGQPNNDPDPSKSKLVAEARAALNTLYNTSPEARHLKNRAAGILIFPDILKAGLIIGGSGGDGVMFSPSGQVMGYYNLASVSYGLQAGAQTFSEAMFMMNRNALDYLDSSAGWSIGAGPSVVVVDSGMGKDFSSTTLRSDVYAFIYGQSGLMAGLGVQGQKITRVYR